MKLDEILASWEDRPEAFTGQKVDTATFIGPNSQAWESGAYQEALKLEKKGMSPEDIWARTGTARSIDGKWRQEISDNESSVLDVPKNSMINYTKLNNKRDAYDGNRFGHKELWKNGLGIEGLVNEVTEAYGGLGATELNINGGTLADTLQHEKLFEAYPGIETSRFKFSPSKESLPGLQGAHMPTEDGVSFGPGIEPWKENRAFTSDGLAVLDSINGDKLFGGQLKRDGTEYDYNKVIAGLGPSQHPQEDQVRQNMSRPNIDIVAPTDKEKGWRSGGRSYNSIYDTILHENQHSVQSLEGFGMGNGVVIDNLLSGKIGDKSIGLADMANTDKEKQRDALYRLQPGEAEARLTSRRRMLDDQGRRQNFPFNQTQELNQPNGTYGFDIDPVKAGNLWESHSPVERPVIIPGAKAGTPVNRPPRTSVEPEPHYAPPFMPTDPDFTKRPGYTEPETIIDLPTQTPSAPEPEQMPIDTHGHEEGHQEPEIPLPPRAGFPWKRLLSGEMGVEETWDAIPGTDIEDWKKKMPPVGNGVGGFMKEEMTEEEFNQLLQEMLRNGKIRSNR